MEQAIHLKDTVTKLDHALARLQEIQSTLRGHSPLPGIADVDITRSLQRPKIPQLRRFDELGGSGVDESAVHWRRWSTPVPLTHDALSEVVATSKFAKKTIDMVKVQKKQAARSTNTSYTSQAKESLLHPSNKVNLPQSVMAAPDDASSKLSSLSKENRKTHHQSKLDLKDATKLQKKGGFGSVEKHGDSRDEASSSLHLGRSDRRVSFARIVPEEHVVSSNIIQLRTLLNGEEAANDLHSHGGQHDAFDCNTHEHDAPGYSMHQHDPINHNMQDQQAASSVKRSSLSMRALMQMEDKERALSRPVLTQDKDEDINSLSSYMASKSFCVQLEEIKSSRKKSWSFSQGKASDNVVVMFPNPTYDEMTPPTSTPPDIKPTIDRAIPKASLHEEVPSTTMMNKIPSDNKARIQKREKIVRLSPCSTTSNAQKSKPQPAPPSDIASASKNASLRKQKWKCTLTHPPPTLIRRLPEVHEIKEIKHYRVACTITPPSGSVGRSQNKTMGDEEDRQTLTNVDHDDDCDSKTRKKRWSFGSPIVVENTPSSSNARRSSLGPPGGGHSFSFLSKHFHAWKLASKQDK